MTACLTFAVPVVVHLDLGSSEAGVSVKFTVVEVGLAITAAHRSLVRFALLKQKGGRMSVQPRKLEHTLTQPSCQVRWSMCAARAQGTPALVTIRDSTALDTTGIYYLGLSTSLRPSWLIANLRVHKHRPVAEILACTYVFPMEQHREAVLSGDEVTSAPSSRTSYELRLPKGFHTALNPLALLPFAT